MVVGGMLGPERSRDELLADYKLQTLSALDKSNLTSDERFCHVVAKSECLLGKIVDTFSQDRQQEVVNAILDMVNLHAGQAPRLSGELVVEHLLEVASLLFDIMRDPQPEDVVVALLHDATEDRAKEIRRTSIDEMDSLSFFSGAEWDLFFSSLRMEHVYGERIKKKLAALVKPDYDRAIAEDVMQQEKEGVVTETSAELRNRFFVEYLKRVLDDLEIGPIKLADFVINATRTNEIPDSSTGDRERIQAKYLNGFEVVLRRIRKPEFAARLKDPSGLFLGLEAVYERDYLKV